MTRISLAYPKIQGSKNSPLGKCIAFEKYDGTNLHWVWERELGWYGFGTRRDRFDLDEMGIADFEKAAGLEEAPSILKEWGKPLEKIFKNHPRYTGDEITVFTEFFGPHSFAGKHKKEDSKELVLFDVETENGMVPPNLFIQDFSTLPIARVVFQGKLTGQFLQNVRDGKYDVEEGVVCKSIKQDTPWMIKVKTNTYMDKLKQAFADDWENYWE